jgi:hypothetical protein
MSAQASEVVQGSSHPSSTSSQPQNLCCPTSNQQASASHSMGQQTVFSLGQLQQAQQQDKWQRGAAQGVPSSYWLQRALQDPTRPAR